MQTELMKMMRSTLSTEGDTGFLIAADAMEESDDATNRRFGELLRLYVEIQTFVRMSIAIPVEKADRYTALNNTFNSENGRIDWSLNYSNQLGPFFLQLTGYASSVANNLTVLEDQPVRVLHLEDAELNNDLRMIFSNHRMGYMNELSISFRYNQRRQEAEVGRFMTHLGSACLRRVTLRQINNRLNIVPALFMATAKVPAGCELMIGTQRVAVKR